MLISEFVFLKRVLNDVLYELFKERKLKNPRIDRTDPDFNKFKREFINASQKQFLKEHPTFKFVYIKRSLREIPLFFSRFHTSKKELYNRINELETIVADLKYKNKIKEDSINNIKEYIDVFSKCAKTDKDISNREFIASECIHNIEKELY